MAGEEDDWLRLYCFWRGLRFGFQHLFQKIFYKVDPKTGISQHTDRHERSSLQLLWPHTWQTYIPENMKDLFRFMLSEGSVSVVGKVCWNGSVCVIVDQEVETGENSQVQWKCISNTTNFLQQGPTSQSFKASQICSSNWGPHIRNTKRMECILDLSLHNSYYYFQSGGKNNSFDG